MTAHTIDFRHRPEPANAGLAASPPGAEADAVARRGFSRPTGTSRRQVALEKRIRRLTGMAIEHFAMIEEGDRIMVCLSGGKDSYTLLDILLKLQAVAPVRFELLAVNLDQKQPGFPEHILPGYLRALGVPFHIETQDTYSIVKRVVPEGKTTCGLCSRLRRGILYRVADELGASKIALGHHRDDILETFFLNLFHGGKLKTMPPKLVSDDGRHVVIRPLAYVPERDIEKYAALAGFPIIPCNLCGSQPNLKRAETKAMLRQWERDFPGRVESTFRALSQVVPTHLLDHSLHDFAAVRADGVARADGDTAFDVMPVDASAGLSSLDPTPDEAEAEGGPD
jgi:tRNA 2-thiocytidine biosynthesis protein TtcA